MLVDGGQEAAAGEAVGGPVVGGQGGDRDRPDPQEAVDGPRPVDDAAEAEHRAEQLLAVLGAAHGGPAPGVRSSVDRSPSGSPSSRALSSRRITVPLLVCGRCWSKSISSGASPPSRRRPKASSSRRRSSVGSKPGRSVTNALTSSPATGSGLPITTASTTAGCSVSAGSTSNGPSRGPAELITSSARPTNQKYPSSSVRARSPLTYQPPAKQARYRSSSPR